METLGEILIIILLATEAICLCKIETIIKRRWKERSEQKSQARRAATRPRAYDRVKKEYAERRNRRQLWEAIENQEWRKKHDTHR